MDGSTNAKQTQPVSAEISLGNNFYMRRWGKFVQISGFNFTGVTTTTNLVTNLPVCLTYVVAPIVNNVFTQVGTAWITSNGRELKVCTTDAGAQKYMTITYLTDTDYTA